MSDSILDRIRSNRKRTIVPTRQDPLMPSTAEDQLIPEDDSLTTVADSKPDSSKRHQPKRSHPRAIKSRVSKISSYSPSFSNCFRYRNRLKANAVL